MKPEQQHNKPPFDFALVYTPEELYRIKQLTLNLRHVSSAYLKMIEDMESRKRRYERTTSSVQAA